MLYILTNFIFWRCFFFCCFLSSLFACKTPSEPVVKTDLIAQDSLVPIWGYRFTIYGDFNGDGTVDTLKEYFRDLQTGLATNKYYEDVYEVAYEEYYNRVLRSVESGLESSDTTVAAFENTSYLGFHWVETIGDVDGNGSAEIGVLSVNCDFSTDNTFTIYTLKNKTWKPLHRFGVNELSFPYLPWYATVVEQQTASFADSTKQGLLEEDLAILDSFQKVTLVAPQTIDYTTVLYEPCDVPYKLAAPIDSVTWITPADSLSASTPSQHWIKLHHSPPSFADLSALEAGTYMFCGNSDDYEIRIFFAVCPSVITKKHR